MVERDESRVKKTVHFDRPIKGSDLVEASRAACNEPPDPNVPGGHRFHQDRTYNDGYRYRIGQTSSHPARNLLVTPNDTDDFFRPDQFYDSAVVSRHDHPGTRFAVRVHLEQEIAAVEDFTERLSRHLPAGLQENAGRSRDPYAPAAGAVTSRPDTTVEPGPQRKDSGPSTGPRSY
jgi:hypothetical protein